MFPGSLIKSCIIMSVSQTIPDYERNNYASPVCASCSPVIQVG